MKTYIIKLDGKEYKVTADHCEDGYTYFTDIKTGEDIHSIPTRNWNG